MSRSSVPWDLVVKAVQAVTDCRWVLLYVKRWLAAPLKHPDGTLAERDEGTPQGSAVSPVLANLFMHYAFDLWMARNFPGCPFERYADDGVVHCTSRRQAEYVLAAITARMDEVGLRLHPDKTRIVYCKDSNRRGAHEHTSFTFLGFAFRPGEARRKDGGSCTSFLPAISLRRSTPRAPGSANCGSTGAPTCRWTTWRVAQSHRCWVDELLRPVLPDRDGGPPPAACQHLPDALGWEQVPATTAIPPKVQALVDRTARSTARPLRPLEMGSRLHLTCRRVRRAR